MQVPETPKPNFWYKLPDCRHNFCISSFNGKLRVSPTMLCGNKKFAEFGIFTLSLGDYKFLVKTYKNWLKTNPRPPGVVNQGETYPLIWEPRIRDLILYGQITNDIKG